MTIQVVMLTNNIANSVPTSGPNTLLVPAAMSSTLIARSCSNPINPMNE